MMERQYVAMFHHSEDRGDHTADICTPIVVDGTMTVAELIASVEKEARWQYDRIEIRPLLKPEDWMKR